MIGLHDDMGGYVLTVASLTVEAVFTRMCVRLKVVNLMDEFKADREKCKMKEAIL